MLDGKLCVICRGEIATKKSRYKQTKYCDSCAKRKKAENSLDPWHRLDRRDYMRRYMRDYRRKHPQLSTAYVRRHRAKLKTIVGTADQQPRNGRASPPSQPACLSHPVVMAAVILLVSTFLNVSGGILSTLTFELIHAFIGKCAVIVVEATGLLITVLYGWRHLKSFWREIE